MKTTTILSFLLLVGLSTPVFGAHTPPTLTDKIDQMIMVGFRGTSITTGSDIDTLLNETNIGGVLLFDYDSQTKTYGKNIVSAPQVTALTTALQERARTPLLIAIDEEGGQVSRLKRMPGFTPLPSAARQSTTSVAAVQAQQTVLASTLHALGITVNFAPVLDLTSANSTMPMTAQARTFSKDPFTVARYAQAVLAGMKSQGIIAVGKHYPGIGEASIDTHKGLATLPTHNENALMPYKVLTQAGTLPAVMVGHVIDTSVDPLLPASLSPAHIAILRQGIGFNGVLFTDDLDMGAITESRTTGQAAVAAVKAGIDVVVISNNITTYNPQVFFDARNALFAAVQNGTISESQIDTSYARIMQLKTPLFNGNQ